MVLKIFLQSIKDYLFPIFCLECQSEGEWWCKKCIEKNNFGVFYCPVCHLRNSDGKPCYHCQNSSYLNGVAAVLDYDQQEVVGKLIRNFKYNFAFDIAQVWSQLADLCVIKIIEDLRINTDKFLIVPVPLHSSRFKERGFNQSAIIADIFYKKLSSRFLVNFETEGLVRKKPTRQQAKLNRQERLANIEKAFIWIKNNPPDKVVILIDDVYTSGATMQECAKILKRAGAQKVFGLTIARD